MAKMADVLESYPVKRKVESAEKLSSDCFEMVPGGVVYFLPDGSQLFVTNEELKQVPHDY